MLFSSTVSTVKCEACGYEHHLVRSTSILFYIGLAAVGTAFMMPPLRRYLGNPHWYQFLCVFICELVVVVGAACVIDRMIMILDGHPLRCPKCGGTMKNAGGGFSHSLIPNIFDLAVGAFFVVLHVAAVIVLKRMIVHGSPV